MPAIMEDPLFSCYNQFEAKILSALLCLINELKWMNVRRKLHLCQNMLSNWLRFDKSLLDNWVTFPLSIPSTFSPSSPLHSPHSFFILSSNLFPFRSFFEGHSFITRCNILKVNLKGQSNPYDLLKKKVLNKFFFLTSLAGKLILRKWVLNFIIL